MPRNRPTALKIGLFLCFILRATIGKTQPEGNYNTSIGTHAGYTLKKGNNNVFIGKSAGYQVKQTNNSLFLGNFAGAGITSERFNFKKITDKTPILTKIVNDFPDFAKERFDYNKSNNTIVSSMNNFIGSDAYKFGPSETILTTIVGSENMGYFAEGHNNIIMSNIIYGTTGTKLYNSIIWGNFMRAETKDNIIAVHQATKEVVPFSQALIYGEFDNRILNINGRLNVNRLKINTSNAPKVDDTFNKVAVANSEGLFSLMDLSELKKDLSNFIKENPLLVKNILDNVDGYNVRLANFSTPDSKTIFYINGDRIDLGKQEVLWTIGDQDIISFKFEDYYDENAPVASVKINVDRYIKLELSADNPAAELEAINGGMGYRIIEIEEVF